VTASAAVPATISFSVTETRNALRCPRVFALGRLRGQQVMFPIGASALGSLFHRLVADFAREAGASRLRKLPRAASVPDIADSLAGSLLLLLAAELARNPTYASMPAEVDDLAEALREFADHVARSSVASGVAPAEAVGRFLAGAELPVSVEVDLETGATRAASAESSALHGSDGAPRDSLLDALAEGRTLPGYSVRPLRAGDAVPESEPRLRLSGRIDALHLPPGGAAEVVEYKLTDDSNEELDRAQVALYRFLLARTRDLDAAPVILRFNPRLTITRLAAREADALVEGQLLPLLADMKRWTREPRSAPPTRRDDLCAACPVRAACAEYYPEPLPARDEPPAGALRPRPDPIGELREGQAAPLPAPPATPIDRRDVSVEAERIRQLILDILRRQGVNQPTARAPIVGARLIQIDVSVARGSVNAIERASADVEHRLEVDHGLTARFHKKGALRLFVIARPQPESIRLAAILAGRADWLARRTGRFVLGETVDRRPLCGDLSEASSCHLLIGGTTGSGKSVLLRCIAASLVHFHSPAGIQLVLVDPKRVSFARLAAALSAHLAVPLLHDPADAIPVLESLIEEMEERYALLEAARVQDIDEYNELRSGDGPLARRVILVDEFQDLLAVKATRERFVSIVTRLGSKARASGIHLVLATQRPTRENVPGGIKANLPGKVALRVASALESRIILDGSGAEALLGAGDLLADLGQGRVRAQAPLDTL
jgi:DNA segregation ATPase FtsK/SpoIIIE, S-DNA-T family